MIYILYGPDSYTCREELENIKKTMGDPEMLSVNTTVVKGSDITPGQLMEICQAVPFVSSQRLIVVEGLLDLFEPEYKQKGGGRSLQARSDKKLEEWKTIASSLDNIPESSILIFVDGRASKNNSLFKLLSPKAVVRNFPVLKDSALNNWIKNKASKIGTSFSDNAMKLLVEYCSNDLWILNNEIDKLAAYCSGKQISEQDVINLTCYSREANVFNLVDAIFDKKIGQTQNILQQLIREGTNTSYIITMVARQLRLIIKAKYLDSKASRERALEMLNLNSEYILNKTINQAKKYSVNQLKECYHRLLQADVDIKTGRYSEDIAIDLLVADLCRY